MKNTFLWSLSFITILLLSLWINPMESFALSPTEITPEIKNSNSYVSNVPIRKFLKWTDFFVLFIQFYS